MKSICNPAPRSRAAAQAPVPHCGLPPRAPPLHASHPPDRRCPHTPGPVGQLCLFPEERFRADEHARVHLQPQRPQLCPLTCAPPPPQFLWQSRPAPAAVTSLDSHRSAGPTPPPHAAGLAPLLARAPPSPVPAPAANDPCEMLPEQYVAHEQRTG